MLPRTGRTLFPNGKTRRWIIESLFPFSFQLTVILFLSPPWQYCFSRIYGIKLPVPSFITGIRGATGGVSWPLRILPCANMFKHHLYFQLNSREVLASAAFCPIRGQRCLHFSPPALAFFFIAHTAVVGFSTLTARRLL